MTARITDLSIGEDRVTPAEAVLTVTARIEGPAVGTELRGKLVGPRRPGHSTIAVAFPLRPAASEGDTVAARVVIPEPNTWTPTARFHYDGVAELWQDGAKVDVRSFTVELKAK